MTADAAPARAPPAQVRDQRLHLGLDGRDRGSLRPRRRRRRAACPLHVTKAVSSS